MEPRGAGPSWTPREACAGVQARSWAGFGSGAWGAGPVGGAAGRCEDGVQHSADRLWPGVLGCLEPPPPSCLLLGLCVLPLSVSDSEDHSALSELKAADSSTAPSAQGCPNQVPVSEGWVISASFSGSFLALIKSTRGGVGSGLCLALSQSCSLELVGGTTAVNSLAVRSPIRDH